MMLSDFPPSVLALILNESVGFLAIELWKCGNTTLNTRLKHGGVVDIALRCPDQLTTLRWPRCLKEFRLKRLSVKSTRHALGSIKMLRSEVQSLHTGLEVLDLCFPGAQAVLFGQNRRPISVVKAPRAKRAKLRETANSSVVHESIWDLNLFWPTLQSLSAKDEQHRQFSQRDSLTSQVFALLPRSLIHLDLQTIRFSDVEFDFSELPPKLQTLKLEDGTIPLAALELLPQTLTDLGVSLADDALASLAENPASLPNLVSFPMREDEEGGFEVKDLVLNQDALQWPKNLKILHLTTSDGVFDDSRPLPSALESLTIYLCYNDFDLDGNLMAQKVLPRSLTHLEIQEFEFDEIEASMWPSNLTTLVTDSAFGPQFFHKLPRSLKHLTLGKLLFRDGAEEEENEGEWDFELSVLLEHGKASLDTEKDSWELLKPTLMARSAQFPVGDASAYIDGIESGYSFGLPLTLRTLKIQRYPGHTKVTPILPPQLEELKMEPSGWSLNNRFWQLLPPSLVLVDILGFEKIPRNMIDPQDPRESTWEKWATLNTSSSPKENALYHASNIMYYRRKSLVPDLWSHCNFLPRSLVHLELSGSNAVLKDVSEIAGLPPTLTHLSLEGTENETMPWLSALPRTLKYLKVHPMAIQGSDLKNLPPTLTALFAYLVETTFDHLLSMPKTIQIFETWGTTTFVGGAEGYLSHSDLEILGITFRPFNLIFSTPRDVVEYEASMGGFPEEPDRPTGPVNEIGAIAVSEPEELDERDEEDDESHKMKLFDPKQNDIDRRVSRRFRGLNI